MGNTATAKAATDEERHAARLAYKREWAKKNPEKIKAYHERYWRRKLARLDGAQETGGGPDRTE